MKFTGQITAYARYDVASRSFDAPNRDVIDNVNLMSSFSDMSKAEEALKKFPKSVGVKMDRFHPVLMLSMPLSVDGQVIEKSVSRMKKFLKIAQIEEGYNFNKGNRSPASVSDLRRFLGIEP